MDYGIFSLLPIVLTLVIVFATKNVFLALLTGIPVAAIIIGVATGDYLTGLCSIAEVFADTGTTKTTLFVLMAGGIMSVVSRSGGVEGLVLYCTEKRKMVKSPIAAQLVSFVLGLLLFVDGTSSIAVTALAGKPFFKKYKVPDEKLALISNSTGSAVAWIVPFGSACAVLTGFYASAAAQLGAVQNPFAVVISSVVFQFYTIALLLIILASIVFRFELGSMRKISRATMDAPSVDYKYDTELDDRSKIKASNILLPIAFLVASIFALLLYTGKGSISAGDGGTAVFVAGLVTLLLTGIWYCLRGICTLEKYTAWCMRGMKNMFDITLILVLAYALGSLLSTIGTAAFIARYAQAVPVWLMPAAAFLTATVIAYATGTSGGTAAVTVPVLIPVMVPMGVPATYLLGAIISGAVFGDQNSPISDSVILTSSMTGVPIMRHVKTQQPYTITAWAVAMLGYLVLGFTCM